MAEWLLNNHLILPKTADTNWSAAQLTCIQKREGNDRLFGTLDKTSFLSRTNHTLKAWDHTWKRHKCEVRSSEGISRIKSSHLNCSSGPTLLDSLQRASRVFSARHEIQLQFPAYSFQGEFLPSGRFSCLLYLAFWVRCVVAGTSTLALCLCFFLIPPWLPDNI